MSIVSPFFKPKNMKDVHIDIETYSSTDLGKCGVYKYVSSPDFEIMLLAYNAPLWGVTDIDLHGGEEIPEDLYNAILDPNAILHAHNATFERIALKRYFADKGDLKASRAVSDPKRWRCSMAMAAIRSLPLGLAALGKALKIDNEKMEEGKELIKLFAMPGKKGRNLPADYPVEYDTYRQYVIRDVEAEMEIYEILAKFDVPERETDIYHLDQKINDTGVAVDIELARGASELAAIDLEEQRVRVSELTGVTNPRSRKQVKEWLYKHTGVEFKSVNKDATPEILETLADPELQALYKELRSLSRTSNAKFDAVIDYATSDNTIRGLFQYSGATATGRWAGRGVQLQNLRRNNIEPIELFRDIVRARDMDYLRILVSDVQDTISQLIRTTLIAPEGKVLDVADYSAIEARVIAWLAREKWRLDVFNSHGKIYEASASMMFGVPIEEVTKEQRGKGKVSELALGYQGGVNAMLAMGGEALGLTTEEMRQIVGLWRAKSRCIVALWYELERCAVQAVKTGAKQITAPRFERLEFNMENKNLTIKLPSGRKLFYISAHLTTNNFGKEAVGYFGLKNGQWLHLDTYGGKLAENITQAVARDLLAEAMLRIDAAGIPICLHVHDEVARIRDEADADPKHLEKLYDLMCNASDWAKGLPLAADGFTTKFYKK